MMDLRSSMYATSALSALWRQELAEGSMQPAPIPARAKPPSSPLQFLIAVILDCFVCAVSILSNMWLQEHAEGSMLPAGRLKIPQEHRPPGPPAFDIIFDSWMS